MENRLKLRISRMFRSSFGSCRSRNISDIIENPVFLSQNRQNFHTIEQSSPKPRPFPSICRPRCSETDESVDNSCIISNHSFPRQKVSERRRSLFISADVRGRMCPLAPPISPLNNTQYSKFHDQSKKKKKKKEEEDTCLKKKKREKGLLSSSSGDINYNRGYWFSSEDEQTKDETDTLFSSKTLSSDSSKSHRRTRHPRKTNGGGRRRRRRVSESSEMGILPLQGKVKDSFAVVKSSSNPHNDFRTSMVEMIVEKQIFAAKDLEQLLQCFLSLNSYQHHRVIIEVFTEIWEALFCNWS